MCMVPLGNSGELHNWTPKSDWHLISPYDIRLDSNIKVTRIKEVIINLRSCYTHPPSQELYRGKNGLDACIYSNQGCQ